MKAGNSTDDKFIMIDHLHRVIKTVLETKIDFYPLAVALDLNNRLCLDVNIKTDDHPSSAMMLYKYDVKLNKMLGDKEILSYCIAVNTLTSKYFDSKETDTIAFVTKNAPEKEAEITYYSYILNKDEKFEITDIWEDRKNVIK